MLQQLAQDTGAQTWAIAAMLFFIGVFAVVVYRVWRTPRSVHEARAQLPLEEASEEEGEVTPTES